MIAPLNISRSRLIGEHLETDDADKEELFASITILCTYELMDAPGTAWSAHLSALPLFSPTFDSESVLGSPIAIPRAAVSGPIFWSLARQDLLCSCEDLS